MDGWMERAVQLSQARRRRRRRRFLAHSILQKRGERGGIELMTDGGGGRRKGRECLHKKTCMHQLKIMHDIGRQCTYTYERMRQEPVGIRDRRVVTVADVS